MEWQKKIQDKCCAYELEGMITNYVKAGFHSDDEILTECIERIEDSYPDECERLTEDEFTEIIQTYRQRFQNEGDQENFRKLDAAFGALRERGIVAQHYAGYTQSDGFADCNEEAAKLEENGETPIGCCFYTPQDLEHILNGDSTRLYCSFGNYLEQPTAVEIGQMVADAFRAAGFSVLWNGSAETKVAIENMKWDKRYTEGEYRFLYCSRASAAYRG